MQFNENLNDTDSDGSLNWLNVARRLSRILDPDMEKIPTRHRSHSTVFWEVQTTKIPAPG